MYQTLRRTGWRCINTHIGFDTPDMPQFDMDHAATGHMAGEYLLRLGLDHYAYAGCSRMRALCDRRDGFLSVMQAAGKAVDRFEAPVILDVPAPGTPSLDQWLLRLPRPAAVYCCDDEIAVQVISKCQTLNISVPDELAVLGTQDDPALCREVPPGLSSVRLPYHQLGYQLMAAADAWLSGGPPPPPRTEMPPSHVVARPSTDLLAVADPQVVRAVREIRNHCCENPDLSEVARHCGLSLRVMQQRFRDLLGHSPGEELRRHRLERVKTLLRETTDTLDEIADGCGFANANNLCEHFKKMTGGSPGAYRKQHLRVSQRGGA
jgi:LacI family transcriptional regulator